MEESEFKEAGLGSLAGEAADVVIVACRGRRLYPIKLGARKSRTGNGCLIAGLKIVCITAVLIAADVEFWV